MCHGFSGPPTHPHMLLTTSFEKWKVSDSFEAKIPLVFTLIVVCKRFSKELVRLGIFAWFEIAQNLHWGNLFLRVLSVISKYLEPHCWNSVHSVQGLIQPTSPRHDWIVPRPFLVVDNDPSSMVWRLQKLIPKCNYSKELFEALVDLMNSRVS